MGVLTIRNLDERIKQALRQRAASCFFKGDGFTHTEVETALKPATGIP